MSADLLKESGTFSHGVLSGGKYYKSFTLEEETMRHTLMVANDTTINAARAMTDDAYYHACLLAARLNVEGVEKVTGEMVEALSRVDGRDLLTLSAQLENRRELFRSQTEAPAEGHPGAAETGLPRGGGDGDEPGEG